MANPAIETIGEVVSEEAPRPASASKVTRDDVPVYTIARTVEWMKRPENAARIEAAAKHMKEATKHAMNQMGDEVAKVKNLFVDIATNDEVKDDFFNSLIKSIID